MSDLKEIVELLEGKLRWRGKSLNEFRSLPPKIQVEVLRFLSIVIFNPKFGKALEDKHGFNLTGCYKIYFDNARRRIVYEVADDGKIDVWGIGLREDLKIYKEVFEIRQASGDIQNS